jgi:hypothetical protein
VAPLGVQRSAVTVVTYGLLLPTLVVVGVLYALAVIPTVRRRGTEAESAENRPAAADFNGPRAPTHR